ARGIFVSGGLFAKTIKYKYIDVTYSYMIIFMVYINSDQRRDRKLKRNPSCSFKLNQRMSSDRRFARVLDSGALHAACLLVRATLRRSGPAAYDANPALARRKRPTPAST